jgi:hypothetical protein
MIRSKSFLYIILYITKKKRKKYHLIVRALWKNINKSNTSAFQFFRFIELYIRLERKHVQRTVKYNTLVA